MGVLQHCIDVLIFCYTFYDHSMRMLSVICLVMTGLLQVGFLVIWIGRWTSHSTIFQLYLWRNIDVQAVWRRRLTYCRAPNAIEISWGPLRCPYNTNTRQLCQSSHELTSLWHNEIRPHNLRTIKLFVLIRTTYVCEDVYHFAKSDPFPSCCCQINNT